MHYAWMAMTRKRFPRVRLVIMSVLFTACVIYLILLCGEYALAYVTRPKGIQLEELKILSQRIVQQDIPQRKAALAAGFKPLISPGNVEASSTLKYLALKYNVAPLAPQPYSKLYLCNEGYGLVRYTSDRFGFRNPDEVWRHDVDVVLIGDSYVHGACVADADTIAGNLSNMFRVLNLGTIGNNPIHYAAIAKTFVPKITTRFVVIVFYANDFDSGRVLSLSYLMHFKNSPHYFEDTQGPLKLSEEITNFYAEADEFAIAKVTEDIDGADLKKKFSPTKRYWSGKRFELKLVREQAVGLFRRLFPDLSLPFSTKLAIDTIVDVCRQDSCTPVVAFIPPSPRWHQDPAAGLYLRLLSDYAQRKGLKFIDGTQTVGPLGDSAYAKLGGHLSPEGYKAFADQLAKALTTETTSER